RVVPDFHAALNVHMVEVSPVLAHRQREVLSGLDVPIEWHQSFDEVPPGRLIVIANEFFDALPIHQAVKLSNGWHERVIEIDRVGNLAFAVASDLLPNFDVLLPRELRDAPVGAFYEWRNDRLALELGRRIARSDGAALVIDYGHAQSAAGET